ncbi:hypothetical protein PAPHI01_1590 [Pancytospora philotis]|nr:hypothetical protein PAPHI01_1590 [Pancytospora philotis]
MLVQLDVPTRLPKELLKKYFSDDSCYSSAERKYRRRHTPHFNNILCKFYAKDNCKRGDECIFSHNAAKFPCVEQAENSVCTRDHCLFRHDAAPSSPHRRARGRDAPSPDSGARVFISPFM